MRRRQNNRHLPPCVYQRHGAYYLVKGGKWTRLGSDLNAAIQEYARLTSLPTNGVAVIIDRVIQDAGERVKESTLSQYKTAARKLKEAFADFSPEQVKPSHVALFMDHYRKTPNMANRMRTLLKMAFDHAVRIGACDSNPVISIKRNKESNRDRYLTDEEYAAIRKAAPLALRSIMDICYLTAQRIGDVLAIRLSDVTEKGILFRQQKTGKRIMVSMTPELNAAVEAAKRLHGSTPRMYLLGQRNGRIRSYRGVRDLFFRAVARTSVEDAHLHDIRAKSLTDAKRQGLNPQILAGHTTEAMTLRYLRSRETDVVTGPSFGQQLDELDNSSKK